MTYCFADGFGSDGQRRISRARDSFRDLELNLLGETERRLKNALPRQDADAGAFGIVTGRDMVANDIAAHMESFGATCVALTAIPDQISDLAGYFVDVDSFSDLDSLIDRLRVLRACHPSVPVVLISSAFYRHDFSTERLAIADVSLRWQSRKSDLLDAVIEARRNNEVWQSRQNR